MVKLTSMSIAVALLIAAYAVPARAQGKPIASSSARCAALKGVNFANVPDAPTEILVAKLVDAAGDEPAYCDVQGYVAPQVGFELLLPASQWNNKFLYAGCGAACGVIVSSACENPLRRGYACIVADMGHKGDYSSSLWSYHNLQAEFDFGIRATHVTALAGKAITSQYYGHALSESYFTGCSNGGLQAMTEAQRFPFDFDGIIAGAPGISETNYYMDMLWNLRALQGKESKPVLTAADLRFVHEAVLAKCDMDDGAKDGIVGNPKVCQFSPAELVCKPGQQSKCLSAPQAEAVDRIYKGPMTSRGINVTPGGASIGSELTWIYWFLGEDGAEPSYTMENVSDMFRYRAFVPDPGPTWNAADFDFDRDYKRLGMMESLYYGTNPDLRKYKAAGGKLIVYQGWEDPLAVPKETIDYYETVEKTMGGQSATQEFARLFMVPGMDHCTGGRGAFAIDYLTYLENWVEKGHAPDVMVGAHVAGLKGREATRLKMPLPANTAIDFTRPVYPYPVAAKYSGSGDVTKAESWTSAAQH
jgi:hypothetical protein